MEREDVLVLLVGGGAVLVDLCVPLRGASRVITPKKYSVSVQLANHKAYTHSHMHMYTHIHTCTHTTHTHMHTHHTHTCTHTTHTHAHTYHITHTHHIHHTTHRSTQ